MTSSFNDYINAIQLFFSIVFRKAVHWDSKRINPLLAWQVAKIVWLEEGA